MCKLLLLGICFQKMTTIEQLYYVSWMLELTLMQERIGVTQQLIMPPFMGHTKCWSFYVKKGFLSTSPKNVCIVISFQTYICIYDNCIINKNWHCRWKILFGIKKRSKIKKVFQTWQHQFALWSRNLSMHNPAKSIEKWVHQQNQIHHQSNNGC